MSRLSSRSRLLPAAFFVLGFTLDVFTLGRIDHWVNMTQQAVYIALLAVLLELQMRPTFELPAWLERLRPYHTQAIHFLFGSLLSCYTIFYFKSASLFTSAAFMLVLAALLVANQVRRAQRSGLAFRYGIFGLCLVSYLSYVVPTLLGSIGLGPFLLAVALAAASLGLAQYRLSRFGIPWARLLRQAGGPGLGVIATFLAFYLFHVIPPVPLSIQSMGIYHDVKRDPSGYRLFGARTDWRLWRNTDLTFDARDGDRIYFFVRVFAPRRFRERLRLRWLFKDGRRGWTERDAIPLEVHGGREEGFRAYAYKRNYRSGLWRVQVETSDGREVGRLYFRVRRDMARGERKFGIERS